MLVRQNYNLNQAVKINSRVSLKKENNNTNYYTNNDSIKYPNMTGKITFSGFFNGEEEYYDGYYEKLNGNEIGLFGKSKLIFLNKTKAGLVFNTNSVILKDNSDINTVERVNKLIMNDSSIIKTGNSNEKILLTNKATAKELTCGGEIHMKDNSKAMEICSNKNIYLNDEVNVKEAYSKGTVRLKSKAKVNKIVAEKNISLESNSQAGSIYSQNGNIVLEGNSSVNNVYLFGNNPELKIIGNAKVKKQVSFEQKNGNLILQTDNNGVLATINPEQVLGGKISTVLTGNYSADYVITEEATVQDNVRINKLYVRDNANLSGKSVINKVYMTGSGEKILTLNGGDVCIIGEVEFQSGKGKVILYKDKKGNYPKILPAQIKGGEIYDENGNIFIPLLNVNDIDFVFKGAKNIYELNCNNFVLMDNTSVTTIKSNGFGVMKDKTKAIDVSVKAMELYNEATAKSINTCGDKEKDYEGSIKLNQKSQVENVKTQYIELNDEASIGTADVWFVQMRDKAKADYVNSASITTKGFVQINKLVSGEATLTENSTLKDLSAKEVLMHNLSKIQNDAKIEKLQMHNCSYIENAYVKQGVLFDQSEIKNVCSPELQLFGNAKVDTYLGDSNAETSYIVLSDNARVNNIIFPRGSTGVVGVLVDKNGHKPDLSQTKIVNGIIKEILKPEEEKTEEEKKVEKARQILGVDENATTDEIKTKAKKLLVKNHPDLGKDENDKEKRTKLCQEINEAKEILLKKHNKT